MQRHLKSYRLSNLALVLLLVASSASAQQWETAQNNVGNPRFVALPYDVVFVAAKINEVRDPDGGGIYGDYQIGTDVLSANEPTGGHQLWIVNRGGAVKKLFPLKVHNTMTVTHPDTGMPVPLIDTPLNSLEDGSVVEPNLSEDGTRVYFGYFHDTSNNIDTDQGGMSRLGSDLYVLDLRPMLANLNVDPSTLPIQRLTFKIYNGSSQDENDKNKDAMNPALAESPGLNGWGTVNMHAVEMRTRDGLKLVYASNKRRLMNSNKRMGHENYNINLHIADLEADGSLGASRQFQYYTTTSAMSPTPLRNGIAFSYQATTADGRNWHIQLSDSEGRWGPLIGYGSNPNLFHLGAFCVDTRGDSHGNPAGDYFTAVHYYNGNNEGFGELWKINLADVGLNTYDGNTSWGVQPQWQGAQLMSIGVTTDEDVPSDIHEVTGRYIGKITTPRCGLPDDLLMSYTPTSANGRVQDNEGNLNIYHAYIAYRSGFDNFDPALAFNPVTNEGLRIVIDDSANDYNLVWPLPVLSWQQRTGDDAQQEIAASIIDPQSTVEPGEPFAQVGTSSLYNTDRKPYDCWLGSGDGDQPYNPNDMDNEQKAQIWHNFDGLTYVQNQSDVCESLTPKKVLGIAVNITSNKTNHTDTAFAFGYETDLTGPKEAVKLLGLYDVRSQGDQSFQATIPAHTPFEFHLIDRQYGLRLLDVRSWHSLKPRETRTNCGGCHQHQERLDVPFAGTVADLQPPLDMVTQTQQVSYDADCQPIVTTTAQPTADAWEWQADIWTSFNQYCGACHDRNQAPVGEPGLNALDYSGESDAYNQLETRYYANSQSGALGSPAFWAARGERTDGRNNDLTTYEPNYPNGKWPYRFSAVHATDTRLNLCGQGDLQKARWVHRFGQWIDNHMPRDTGDPYPYKFDTYHPAVDVAVVDNSCLATTLQVGYWDDTGLVQEVKVFVDGVAIDTTVNTTNGKHLIGNLNLTDDNVIKVRATDLQGNRQFYEKSVKQLKDECVPSG